ncbi:34987_t:CDS:1, partial [Gigaspora margarita]
SSRCDSIKNCEYHLQSNKTEMITRAKVYVLTKSQVSESERIECKTSEIKVDTSSESYQIIPFQYQNIINTLYVLAKSQLEEKVL